MLLRRVFQSSKSQTTGIDVNVRHLKRLEQLHVNVVLESRSAMQNFWTNISEQLDLETN